MAAGSVAHRLRDGMLLLLGKLARSQSLERAGPLDVVAPCAWVCLRGQRWRLASVSSHSFRVVDIAHRSYLQFVVCGSRRRWLLSGAEVT